MFRKWVYRSEGHLRPTVLLKDTYLLNKTWFCLLRFSAVLTINDQDSSPVVCWVRCRVLYFPSIDFTAVSEVWVDSKSAVATFTCSWNSFLRSLNECLQLLLAENSKPFKCWTLVELIKPTFAAPKCRVQLYNARFGVCSPYLVVSVGLMIVFRFQLRLYYHCSFEIL